MKSKIEIGDVIEYNLDNGINKHKMVVKDVDNSGKYIRYFDGPSDNVERTYVYEYNITNVFKASKLKQLLHVLTLKKNTLKLILFSLVTILVSCNNSNEQTLYGVVVDVVSDKNIYIAHVHYNDTICCQEYLDFEVVSGDSICRKKEHITRL